LRADFSLTLARFLDMPSSAEFSVFRRAPTGSLTLARVRLADFFFGLGAGLAAAAGGSSRP
jgi:hypothetical protein